MRRFSIAKLMGLIGIIAFGIAALRAASDLWVGIVLLATLGLLAIAILGIAYRCEGKRAWWFGFALFGWGYWLVTAGPWFAQEIGTRLPTAQLLVHLHEKLQPQPVSPYYVIGDLVAQSSGMPWTGTAESQGISPVAAPNVTTPGISGAGTPSGTIAITTTPAANNSKNPGIFTVNFLLATNGNQEQFLRIGHCLFAILAAFLGGFIATLMHKGRSRQSAAA